jgi:3',5'-cyclic AMP phosphodiesterase CpdA
MRDYTYYAIITDQHIVEPDSSLYGLDTQTATECLIESIIAEPVPLAGIVCLGDLADTVLNPDRMTAVAGHEAYRHAQHLLGSLRSKMFTLPGNHDDPELLNEYFPSKWHKTDGGVTIANLQGFDLIGIDVRTGPEPTGLASSESIKALDLALASTEKAILVSHYPLFDLDNQRIDDELSTINRVEIQEVIHRHAAKVAACFHGHLHIWIAGYQNGILTHSVPSSSFTFILEPQEKARETVGNHPCGYLLLGIGKDGSVIVRPRFLPSAQRIAS